MGVHRFEEAGADHYAVAKFVHVWKRTAEGWKVARVLSLDHCQHPVRKPVTATD